MKKLCLFVCVFLFFFRSITFPQQSLAQTKNNFTTSYDVTYTVHDDGTTHAVFTIALKNTSSDYYVSTYSLQIGFNDIENVSASDGLGPIVPDVTQNKNGYLVSLHFNKKVVGVDKILNFTLSFDSSNVAQKVGQVWEINIPGIAHQQDFEDFNVHVYPAASFGKPSIIKPPQISDQLDFTKQQLGTAGISIVFGSKQMYAFDVAYHLENNNLFPMKQDIALPPETNYQYIAIQNINPPPSNVYLDKDGNWMASYMLYPSKKLDVFVKGRASVSLNPKEEQLSNKDFAAYTDEQPYWNTNNTSIKQLAQQLATPQRIYDYVRTHLVYDFSRVSIDQKRLGSAYVLEHPQSAVCLEFTDLFIALVRAAHIPAREIEGFAYSQNTKERPLSLLHDVLHAWPEYYDKNKHTWIMVDPTWGNTTGGVDYFHVLDLDHIAFAINGYNSSYPVPAGGYKLTGQENQRDVHVTFTGNTVFPDPKIAINDTIPNEVIAGIPIFTTITVQNAGEVAVPQQHMTVTAKGIYPKEQTITIPVIPPYGHADIPINFQRTAFLTNSHALITIQIGSSSFSKTVSIIPMYLKKEVVIGGVIFVILCVIISIIATRSRRV